MILTISAKTYHLFAVSFVLFFCLLFSPNTLAEPKFEYTGEVGVGSAHYIFNRADHDINDQINGDVAFGLLYDNNKFFLLNLKPQVRVDALDFNRNRYWPDEAYFKFYNSHIEFSAGMQVVPWGVAHSFNPTNVINRPDLERNYYRPALLGDPMARLKFSNSASGFLSEWGVEFLAVPLFLETPLPKGNSRFAIEGNAGGLGFTNNDEQETPERFDSIGLACTVSATLKATDIKLHYYHGPERTPAFVLSLDDALNLKTQPFYYTIDMAGLNIESVINKFTFHAEAAFKSTESNPERRHEIPLVDTSDAIPNSYLQFVTGVDYTLDGFLGEGTLIVTAEYLGENEHTIIFEEFRPLKNDLFVGARWMLNNVSLTQLEFGLVKDLTNQEMIVFAEASTNIYKELKLTLGGMIVNQDSDPNLPLSFFDNNTSVFSRLSYSFGGSLLKKPTP